MAELRGGDGAVELARLREFLWRSLPRREGYVVSNINILDDCRDLLGGVTRSRRYGFQVDSESRTFRCKVKNAPVVQVFENWWLVRDHWHPSLSAPGTWISPALDEFVGVLPTLPSLSTLDLTLSTLWLNVDAIARCFSGASDLRSCTLRVNPCQTSCQNTLRTMLRPLTTGANTEIQELVLQCTQPDSAGCAFCEDAIIDLVKHNGHVGSELASWSREIV